MKNLEIKLTLSLKFDHDQQNTFVYNVKKIK